MMPPRDRRRVHPKFDLVVHRAELGVDARGSGSELGPVDVAFGERHAQFGGVCGSLRPFFSSIFLPRRLGARFVLGSLVLGLRLGFYLIGGTVAPNPWVALIFTFLVCLNLSFMSGWKVGGPLALTPVMIYTAGLNTGSPDKASANFLVFAFVMGWSGLISLLPFWTPAPPPPVNENQSTGELAEQGLRMR